MTYWVEKESYGRKEKALDIQRLATDLARLLGGVVENRWPENADSRADIVIGESLVSLYWSYGGKSVEASISARDIPAHLLSDVYSITRTESANFSPDKALAAIAKDIKRRVIDASAGALAKQREYVAKRQSIHDSLLTLADEVHARNPALTLRRPRHSGNDTAATVLQVEVKGFYLNAEVALYEGGFPKVRIRHIDSIPLDKFERIVAIMLEK